LTPATAAATAKKRGQRSEAAQQKRYWRATLKRRLAEELAKPKPDSRIVEDVHLQLEGLEDLYPTGPQARAKRKPSPKVKLRSRSRSVVTSRSRSIVTPPPPPTRSRKRRREPASSSTAAPKRKAATPARRSRSSVSSSRETSEQQVLGEYPDFYLAPKTKKKAGPKAKPKSVQKKPAAKLHPSDSDYTYSEYSYTAEEGTFEPPPAAQSASSGSAAQPAEQFVSLRTRLTKPVKAESDCQ
jgi:hypothetical protein